MKVDKVNSVGKTAPPDSKAVMSKIQNNPTAMNLMMEAMSDSDLRSALQVAIGGSPADLLKAGLDNPKIAILLKEL